MQFGVALIWIRVALREGYCVSADQKGNFQLIAGKQKLRVVTFKILLIHKNIPLYIFLAFHYHTLFSK